MIFLCDSQSHQMSYFVTWLKYDFLDHAYILLVGRHVYSVAKFRGGFSENNLANFAKLTCTIKLRLCANTVLGRLYYLCTTWQIWRLEKFSSTLQIFTQLVILSMEIEKQIAFDNNNVASFRKKWVLSNNAPQKNNLIQSMK